MNELNEFFEDGVEIGKGSEEALLKALTAGFGTDAREFTGGRALQPEDCETTLFNVMREQREDFKLMNCLKKSTVKSTVRQYNIRTDVGEEDIGFVGEGEIAPDNYQDIRRMTRDMAFIQKRGAVTEQAIVVDTFEDAFEAEKFATTMSVLKTAEKYCIHGDSKVVGKQYDGLLAQIRDTPIFQRNIQDLRGQSIGTVGEAILTDMATRIADQGGEANKIFYPLILGQDLQDMVRERLRFGTSDNRGAIVIKEYPTLYGSLSIAGDDAGPNKMFRPKNIIKPLGKDAPNRPVAVTLSAVATDNSQFGGTDAGNLIYEIFAVSEYGISEGVRAAAPVAVASGDGVTITIQPAAVNPGSGFIICRSKPSGTVTMEMVRIGRDVTSANTTYLDLNDDLPGTTEMLFLTEKRMQVVAEFFQLLPMRLYRMYPWNTLVTPFIMALWGTPALKAPHWCGVVKNIAYKGGF
jgi:hypothetical protein